MQERAAKIVRPALLCGALPNRRAELLFWSGGKDSFLALRARLRAGTDPTTVVLLTTFGLPKRVVAHQEVSIASVVEQAKALELPLVGVPLPPGADSTTTLTDALNWVAAECGVARLVFGDLHLEHIRAWREEALAPVGKALGASTNYPLWQREYSSLLADFLESGARARVCAAPDVGAIAPVRMGEVFGPELTARLPEGIDAFGESGEFHTYVEPDSLSPARTWFART